MGTNRIDLQPVVPAFALADGGTMKLVIYPGPNQPGVASRVEHAVRSFCQSRKIAPGLNRKRTRLTRAYRRRARGEDGLCGVTSRHRFASPTALVDAAHHPITPGLFSPQMSWRPVQSLEYPRACASRPLKALRWASSTPSPQLFGEVAHSTLARHSIVFGALA